MIRQFPVTVIDLATPGFGSEKVAVA